MNNSTVNGSAVVMGWRETEKAEREGNWLGRYAKFAQNNQQAFMCENILTEHYNY